MYLHFEGFDIDANKRPSDIIVDEMGSLEEFSLLSVEESTKGILSIPEVGADTSVFKIDNTVIEVAVLNDVANIFRNGNLVARLEYLQAIAFHTGSGIIMLDKEACFSQLIVIKRAHSIGRLLYDEPVNWGGDNPEEDPSTHFEFHTETDIL